MNKRWHGWLVAAAIMAVIAFIAFFAGYNTHAKQTENERFEQALEFDKRVEGRAIEMYNDRLRNKALIEEARDKERQARERTDQAWAEARFHECIAKGTNTTQSVEQIQTVVQKCVSERTYAEMTGIGTIIIIPGDK